MQKTEALAQAERVVPPGPAPSSSPSTATRLSAADFLFKGVEAFLALLLLAMVIMVLSNVVLRYGFSTGIASSEELSRTAFIWLTFIGAVVAAREGTHLGVDSLLRRLPRNGQLAITFLSELIIVGCCVLLFRGTWSQHEVNATTASLVTGMPMSWVFGVGYFTSVGIGVLSLLKMLRIATGRATDRDIFGAAADHLPASMRVGGEK